MPHTVPNSPTNGARGPDRGEIDHVPLELLHLAAEGDIHDPLDPLLQAGLELGRGQEPLGGGAAPFAHGRDEYRRHRIGRALADAVEQVLERAARPERLLELLGAGAQAAQAHQLAEDDGPAPERGQDQQHHHALDDDVGVEEQPADGHVGVDLHRARQQRGIDRGGWHGLDWLHGRGGHGLLGVGGLRELCSHRWGVLLRLAEGLRAPHAARPAAAPAARRH